MNHLGFHSQMFILAHESKNQNSFEKCCTMKKNNRKLRNDTVRYRLHQCWLISTSFWLWQRTIRPTSISYKRVGNVINNIMSKGFLVCLNIQLNWKHQRALQLKYCLLFCYGIELCHQPKKEEKKHRPIQSNISKLHKIVFRKLVVFLLLLWLTSSFWIIMPVHFRLIIPIKTFINFYQMFFFMFSSSVLKSFLFTHLTSTIT